MRCEQNYTDLKLTIIIISVLLTAGQNLLVGTSIFGTGTILTLVFDYSI